MSNSDFIYAGGAVNYYINKYDLDTLTYQARATIPTTGIIYGIVADGSYLYTVGNYSYLHKIYIQTLDAVKSEVITPATKITSDNNYLYCAQGSNGTIRKYDKATLTLQATSNVSYGGSVNTIGGVELKGEYIYIGGGTIRKIYKYDTATLTKQDESIQIGGTDIRTLNIDDTFAYVTGAGSYRKIYKFDLDTLTLQDESLAFTVTPYASCIFGDYIYIAAGNGSLLRFDLDTLALQDTTPTSFGIIRKIVGKGNYIYMCGDNGYIYKLDIDTLSIQDTSPAFGNAIWALCIPPDYTPPETSKINTFFGFNF